MLIFDLLTRTRLLLVELRLHPEVVAGVWTDFSIALVSHFLKGAYPGRTLSWHLTSLLMSSAVAQYKPLEKSNLKLLSHKTPFLLAAWPTKRFSELHALSMSKEC